MTPNLRMHAPAMAVAQALLDSTAVALAYATYWLEDGYLAAVPVMVGLDVLAVVAVQFRELGRHPLVPLVQVFARWGSQRRLVVRIVMVGGRRLDRRQHLCGRRRNGCLHLGAGAMGGLGGLGGLGAAW